MIAAAMRKRAGGRSEKVECWVDSTGRESTTLDHHFDLRARALKQLASLQNLGTSFAITLFVHLSACMRSQTMTETMSMESTSTTS